MRNFSDSDFFFNSLSGHFTFECRARSGNFVHERVARFDQRDFAIPEELTQKRIGVQGKLLIQFGKTDEIVALLLILNKNLENFIDFNYFSQTNSSMRQ